MIFRSRILSSLLGCALTLATSPMLGVSSSMAAAEELTCTIGLDVYTWEDKSLPTKQVPVPSINVLKYGVVAVFLERFDILAGRDTWLTSDTFRSYQLQAAPSDDNDDDDDVPSFEALVLGHTDSKATIAADASEPGSGSGPPFASSSSSTTASSLRSSSSSSSNGRSLQFMPSKCWRDYKCRAAYMRKYRSRIMMNGYIHRSNAACNLCPDDDDYDSFTETDTNRLEVLLSENDTNYTQITLDQLVSDSAFTTIATSSAAAASSVRIESPLHKAFERDVCSELKNLGEDYDSFERSGGCTVDLRCRRATEDERAYYFQDGPSIVTDRRSDGDGSEHHGVLLYSIAAEGAL